MNISFLEELLLESEGTALDFKSKQYEFTKAGNDKKSELLKDILAFANSFRRTDAYILIGVEEAEEQAARVVGVEDHLPDADLQQFVNSKTNRSIEFSYEVVPTSNGLVGVIRVPEQARPLYLNRDFGRLKKNVVYYRLGSSTAEASPDVVASMGAVDRIGEDQTTPVLHLELANVKDRKKKGITLDANAIAYDPHDPGSFPDYENGSELFSLHRANRDYWRELAYYIRLHSVAVPLGLFIENRSRTLARNVIVKIFLPLSLGVEVFDELPDLPEWRLLMHNITSLPNFIGGRDDSVSVEKFGDTWNITFHIGNIQPNTQSWSEDLVYLGPFGADHLMIDATISADNFPKPCNVPLEMNFNVEHREKLNLENLKTIHTERIMKKFEDEA